jgi:hypothetical protein
MAICMIVAGAAGIVAAAAWEDQKAIKKELEGLVRHLKLRGVSMTGYDNDYLVDNEDVRLLTRGAVEYAEKAADSALQQVKELREKFEAPVVLRPAEKVEAYRKEQHG